jgi:hypothetical protein
MDSAQRELLQRIESFALDEELATLPFSLRLATHQGWSSEFTNRAIREYKRFAFLAMVAGHTVSPSDPVDQVWHEHLTYTRSYWDEFCGKVLRQPLHQEPSRGGAAEARKFAGWYEQTLDRAEVMGEAVAAAAVGETDLPRIFPPAWRRFTAGANRPSVGNRQVSRVCPPRVATGTSPEARAFTFSVGDSRMANRPSKKPKVNSGGKPGSAPGSSETDARAQKRREDATAKSIMARFQGRKSIGR